MVQFNKNFTFAVFAVCLVSAFPHGYHMGVTNILQEVMMRWMLEGTNETELRPLAWSVAVTMFPAGSILGSLFTNTKTSFQKILFYGSFLTIASQIFLNMSKEAGSFVVFAMGRFFMGVSTGMSGAAASIYLSEIASVDLRGLVVSIHQFFVTMSLFYAQIFGLPKTLGTQDNWIVAIMVATIPSAIGTLAVKFCPETPKHVLITEDNEVKAMMNLAWLKGSTDISQEYAEIRRERDIIKMMPEITLHNIWSTPLLVCFVVVISEQLCGLVYYSSDIFRHIGLEENYPYFATVSMGVSMLFGLTIYLGLVEIVGRRILFLVSLGSLFFITILLTVALLLAANYSHLQNSMKYLALGSVLLFGTMYGVGVGPARWLIIVETFNYTARPLVASLVLPVNFLISAIVAQTFLLMKCNLRYYIFVPFICFDLAFFGFSYFYLPETLVKIQEDPVDA